MASTLIPSNVKPPLAELGVGDFQFGGVSTPFTSGAYDFTSLQYPQELGSYGGFTSFQGHYINFYINVHKASTFWKKGGYDGAPSQYSQTNAPGVGGTAAGEGTQGFGAQGQQWFYQRTTQAISLYIPDTMQTEQSVQWDDSSLLGLGKSLANAFKGDKAGQSGGFKDAKGGLKSSAMNSIRTISKSGVINDVANAAGAAINPQLLVIFRGIVNRHFSYEFYFTPRNESEAKAVRDIIKAFRYHAHPELAFDLGAFFIAPSTFDIEFIHKGTRNTNIHAIKTCVLQNYTVDYAPAGWSTYNDGMPVQTRLVLHFMETDWILKQDVEAGY